MDSDESKSDDEMPLKDFIPLGTEDVAPQTESSKNLHPLIRQQMKQPRCKSSVWIYFQRLDKSLAKCRICQGNYRFGSSISNLRHHAEVKHRDVLKQGTVKFLEQLKVPKEQMDNFVHTVNQSKPIKEKNSKRKNYKMMRRHAKGAVQIKAEPKYSGQTNASGIDDEEIQQTLDSIYEKGDESINTYIQLPNSTTNSYQHNDYSIMDEEDETAMDFNPLNTTAAALGEDKFQYFKQERIRAETNYFNKKAAYMERSTEYVEAQKQHVLLQSEKLKMEISAMKQGFLSP